METQLNVNSRLKDLDYDQFLRAIKVMLNKIWMDSGVKYDKEMFDHTLKSVGYSIYNYHSTLLFAEIQVVFKGISLGTYKCTRISSNSILGALNEFLEAKRKRVAMQGDLEHSITKKRNSFVFESGLPIGQAILFKMEQRDKGITTFDNMPTKEIAEKINSGELKVIGSYRRKNKY